MEYRSDFFIFMPKIHYIGDAKFTIIKNSILPNAENH